VSRDLVLIGGGHSHVEVLRRFGRRPLPGVAVTLISRDAHTPYSGMLPGYIAGHYGYDDVHIDLARLAAFAGARFVRDAAVGIDRATRIVRCSDHPPLRYDLLSVNIGSTPQTDSVPGAGEHTVPVKPIHRFNDRWLALLDRVTRHQGAMRIAVVGGGAGGVELTLAMQYRLRNELTALGRDPDSLQFDLFTLTADVLPTHNARVRRRFDRVLAARCVRVHRNAEVVRVADHRLTTRAGEAVEADEIVWVTAAAGAAWLAETGLERDERGFLCVNDHLQTVTDPRIFAAGDVASQAGHPREKAGVLAVRHGPPLAANLRRALAGRALMRYRPQRKWLALITTGDRRAVASRGSLDFEGDWIWRWKDRIDRRFMARYNDIGPSARPADQPC
jgi:selenide, water dikinase